MRYLPLIFFAAIASGFAYFDNTEMIIESDAVLPAEFQDEEPLVRVMPPSPVPLEPQEAPFKIQKGYPKRARKGNVMVAPQQSVPLTSPDIPNMIPLTVNPLDQYAKAVLSNRPQDKQYRIINMQLNDFGVAMSRRAGLQYIYNPAVRGTINGIFKNSDPIHMLRVAAKNNGYRLVIKDGVKAQFQKERTQ